MPSISSLLRTIDMFRYQHRIMYKNTSTQSTACGGIITIISAIFFGFTLVFFSRELYEKNDPIVSFDEQQQSEARIPIRDLELFIVFIDAYGNLVHLNPEFYKTFELNAAKLTVDNQNGSGILKYSDIDVVPCTDELISDEAIDAHGIKIQKNIGLCLNVPRTFEVVNEFSSIDSVSFVFSLRLCDESKNPGCRAFFKSINTLQSIVYSKEQFFNPGDFLNPVGTRILATQTDITEGLEIIRSQIIQVNEALLDDAVIFSFTDKRTFYSISDSNIQMRLYEESIRDIFEMRFEATKLKKIFKRRYLKIQELIAFVGGFAKGIISLGAGFGRLYGNYSFLSQNIDFIQEKEAPPSRQTSVELKQSSNNTERELSQKTEVVRRKLSLWNFLVGNASSSYLRKRNIDYSPLLRKFDAFHVYDLITSIDKRVQDIEKPKDQV